MPGLLYGRTKIRNLQLLFFTENTTMVPGTQVRVLKIHIQVDLEVIQVWSILIPL